MTAVVYQPRRKAKKKPALNGAAHLLAVLIKHGALSVKMMGRRMKVSKPSVYTRLETLEKHIGPLDQCPAVLEVAVTGRVPTLYSSPQGYKPTLINGKVQL